LNKHAILTRDKCTPEALNDLSLDVYNHVSIRMLGVAENEVIKCATEGPKLHLSRYSVHNVTDDLKLMAAKDTYDSRDELLLVKQHNTEQLFASLTPFLIGHLE
ncbi:EAL domain-containing protein, partial [Vibrio sp. 10N.222.48.A8]